jgi:hypothetical protein
MLDLRDPAVVSHVPYELRAYTIGNQAPGTRAYNFDSGGGKVVARHGWSLCVSLFRHHSLALTESRPLSIGGNLSLLWDTNGGSSEDISHTGGRYGSVTTAPPFSFSLPTQWA